MSNIDTKHIFEFVFKKKDDKDIEVEKVLYGTDDKAVLEEQTVNDKNDVVQFKYLLDIIKTNNDNFVNFTIDDVKPKSGTESAQTPGTEPAPETAPAPGTESTSTPTSTSTSESTPREIQEKKENHP
jgi:hypothetical protein